MLRRLARSQRETSYGMALGGGCSMTGDRPVEPEEWLRIGFLLVRPSRFAAVHAAAHPHISTNRQIFAISVIASGLGAARNLA